MWPSVSYFISLKCILWIQYNGHIISVTTKSPASAYSNGSIQACATVWSSISSCLLHHTCSDFLDGPQAACAAAFGSRSSIPPLWWPYAHASGWLSSLSGQLIYRSMKCMFRIDNATDTSCLHLAGKRAFLQLSSKTNRQGGLVPRTGRTRRVKLSRDDKIRKSSSLYVHKWLQKRSQFLAIWIKSLIHGEELKPVQHEV